MSPAPAGALSVLLHNAIDYAGLFPPASLSMAEAVERYASYRASDDAWALGRFVVPAARLEEFAAAGQGPWRSGGADAGQWRVSALVADFAQDLAAISRFNITHRQAVVDTIEVKASTAAAIEDVGSRVPPWLAAFAEIPASGEPDLLLQCIRATGLRAKIRTGGVTADAFPAASDVVRFIAACVDARVPFKATAGLHHPIRAPYRLTYAPDSTSAPMYGFLNVFLATALLRQGGTRELAEQLLLEEEPSSLTVTADTIAWRGHQFDLEALRGMRTQLAGFGSCSFREPIDDLTTLGFL